MRHGQVPVKILKDLLHRQRKSGRLSALAGHPIQDIETWDESDEDRAMHVMWALLHDQPIANLGDDAQLLAGATLALLGNPDLYDRVTQELNRGLDVSFRRDPIWEKPQSDRVIIRYGRQPVKTAA